MKILYRGGAAPMTKASSESTGSAEQTSELRNPPQSAPSTPPACAAEQAECPRCAGAMHLWAGFYRCPNCGFKESCCF